MLEAVEEIVQRWTRGLLPPERLGVTFERLRDVLADSRQAARASGARGARPRTLTRRRPRRSRWGLGFFLGVLGLGLEA